MISHQYFPWILPAKQSRSFFFLSNVQKATDNLSLYFRNLHHNVPDRRNKKPGMTTPFYKNHPYEYPTLPHLQAQYGLSSLTSQPLDESLHRFWQKQ